MEEVKGEGARKEHGSLPSGCVPSFSLLNVTSLVAYVIYRFAIFVQKTVESESATPQEPASKLTIH